MQGDAICLWNPGQVLNIHHKRNIVYRIHFVARVHPIKQWRDLRTWPSTKHTSRASAMFCTRLQFWKLLAYSRRENVKRKFVKSGLVWTCPESHEERFRSFWYLLGYDYRTHYNRELCRRVEQNIDRYKVSQFLSARLSPIRNRAAGIQRIDAVMCQSRFVEKWRGLIPCRERGWSSAGKERGKTLVSKQTLVKGG